MTRRQTLGQNSSTVTLGPFGGVNDTIDAGEERPTILQDLINGYIPDPERGSDAMERPGFVATVSGLNGGIYKTQAIHEHTATDGTVTRLVVVGNKVYRLASDLTTATDITPAAGVTINATANHVYLTSFGDEVLVNDETNTPWRLSSLTTTPAVGTKIDIDGAGSAWVATGKPVVYYAKAVFILKSVAAGADAGNYGNTIVWSEEADASLGYRQSGYDNLWELTQTSNEPIYAVHGTNEALYYFREHQIGAITGAVNADFKTTGTHDSVSLTVGTKYAATVCEFDGAIYFADPAGRPYRVPLGAEPEAIWLQMRTAAKLLPWDTTSIDNLVWSASACVCADLGLVVFALWQQFVGARFSADPLYVFDGRTGTYAGRWSLTDEAPGSGVPVDCMGLLHGSSGTRRLMLGAYTKPHTSGDPTSRGNRGTLWRQRLIADGDCAGDTNSGVAGVFASSYFAAAFPSPAQDPHRAVRVDTVVAEGTWATYSASMGSGTVTVGVQTPHATSTLTPAMSAANWLPASNVGGGTAMVSRWRARCMFGPNGIGRVPRLTLKRQETAVPLPQTGYSSLTVTLRDAGFTINSGA